MKEISSGISNIQCPRKGRASFLVSKGDSKEVRQKGKKQNWKHEQGMLYPLIMPLLCGKCALFMKDVCYPLFILKKT